MREDVYKGNCIFKCYNRKLPLWASSLICTVTHQQLQKVNILQINMVTSQFIEWYLATDHLFVLNVAGGISSVGLNINNKQIH